MTTKQLTGLAQRLDTLEGKTIGLFWNTKPNGDVFFDRVAELLGEQFKNIKVIKYYPGKSMPTEPGDPSAIKEVAEKCDGVINGFGD